MKIFDITKNMFEAEAQVEHPQVTVSPVSSIAKGAICNTNLVSFGTHTGTHLDAPAFFIEGGKGVSEIPLEKCIGPCEVVESDSDLLDASTLAQLLPIDCKRLLIKGPGVLTPQGAAFLVRQNLFLLGTENALMGDSVTGPLVYRTLLGGEVVILKNLNLQMVKEGKYTLLAQPLKMEGMDGSPVRAVLLQ